MLAVAESGQPVKALENRPQLAPGLDFYFEAYQELQTERSVGMDVGPIPWSSIVQWAQMRGVTDMDEINDLIDIIRDMESTAKKFESSK